MDSSRNYGLPWQMDNSTQEQGQQSDASRNPELERILAELSSFTGPAVNSSLPTVPVIPPYHAAHSLPFLPLEGSSCLSTYTEPPRPAQASVAAESTNAHTITGGQATHKVIEAPSVQSRPVVINPSTIFDWPQALRCVSKIAAGNAQFGSSIKSIIDDQERNNQQWWEERTAMIKTQETRADKVNELNKVLKSVGGKLQEAPTPEQYQAEIARYDQKVYKASVQMANAHGLQLKGLGVPFFGVDPKYIIKNELQQTAAARDPLSQATITESELLLLQGKMIQHLEDLYRD